MTNLEAIKERIYCPSAIQAVRIGEYEECARAIVEHDAPALVAEVERLRAEIRSRGLFAAAAVVEGFTAELEAARKVCEAAQELRAEYLHTQFPWKPAEALIAALGEWEAV